MLHYANENVEMNVTKKTEHYVNLYNFELRVTTCLNARTASP